MSLIFLGPRKERFNPRFAHTFEPSNQPFIALATLSLYVCWLYFNAGSTLGATNENAEIIGLSGANTMISGASGGLTVFTIHYFLNMDSNNRYSLVMLCNGNLAGLVSITASNDIVEFWAAALIGCLGGIVYILVNRLLL